MRSGRQCKKMKIPWASSINMGLTVCWLLGGRSARVELTIVHFYLFVVSCGTHGVDWHRRSKFIQNTFHDRSLSLPSHCWYQYSMVYLGWSDGGSWAWRTDPPSETIETCYLSSAFNPII